MRSRSVSEVSGREIGEIRLDVDGIGLDEVVRAEMGR